MNRLKDKVVIITGASSGIGRETAILFFQQGAKLVLADVNQQGAEETIQLAVKKQIVTLTDQPDRDVELMQVFSELAKETIVFQKTDVSQPQQVEALCQRAMDEFGRLDVVFNNAGIMHPQDDDAVQTEEQIWDLTMNINLKGVFLGCKYAIPHLRKNPNGGSIINTASIVALVGSAAPQLAYTASKGGVIALSQELATVHAKEKIRVNALCPGPLRTELLMKFLDTPEKLHRRLVHIPMGRFGEAKEIAQAALFLASDESQYVTGTKFVVDGGLTSAYVTPE